MTTLLELRDLRVGFGGLRVIEGLSLDVRAGERHAIIGPNGAGKTTIVNLISGRLRPQQGRVLFAGRDVTRLPPYRRARAGLVCTFQITSLFWTFSAVENVALTIAEREGYGISLRTRRGFPTHVLDEAEALAQGVGLRRSPVPVAKLAYGQQRLVEFALALALRPLVLLLDEPAAGLSMAEHDLLLGGLDALRPDAATVLIEHDMELVFRFAHRVSVLAGGLIVAQGSPAEISESALVRDLYLGRRR